jgi:hypothetical protein
MEALEKKVADARAKLDAAITAEKSDAVINALTAIWTHEVSELQRARGGYMERVHINACYDTCAGHMAQPVSTIITKPHQNVYVLCLNI